MKAIEPESLHFVSPVESENLVWPPPLQEKDIFWLTDDGPPATLANPGVEVAPTVPDLAILLQAPHGTRLGHLTADSGQPAGWNLWVSPLLNDSTVARRIRNDRWGQPWSSSWFPDHRRLAFLHEDTLVVFDLATGDSREFASPVSGSPLRTPAVSPDGTKIVFQVHRHSAWLVEVENGRMRCVLTDPSVEELAWSADGRHIAFHSRRDRRWGVFTADAKDLQTSAQPGKWPRQ